MRADTVRRLGDGTPGLLSALGGPSQPGVAGASAFRLARLGGQPKPEEKQGPLRTAVFKAPVVLPETVWNHDGGNGATADGSPGGGDGTGGPSGEGGDA